MTAVEPVRLPVSLATRPGSHWWMHPWARFAARRTMQLVVSVLLLVSASFAMIHAVPGDPVRAALGLTAPPAQVAARRHDLGLDRPLWHQYVQFLHGVVTGDLGTSMTSQLPVSQIIADRLPLSAELALLAFAAVLLIGVPAGMLAAVLTREGRRPRLELGFSGATGFFAVVPEFLLGVEPGVRLRREPAGAVRGRPGRSVVLCVARGRARGRADRRPRPHRSGGNPAGAR